LQDPTDLNTHGTIIVADGLLYKDLMGRGVAVLTGDEVIKIANLIRTICERLHS
jgi:hypothetical protein